MKIKKRVWSFALLMSGSVFFVTSAANATFLNAPHDEEHGVTCRGCHENPLNTYGSTDEICALCHVEGGIAPVKITHSSQECTVCHDPHFQPQLAHGSVAYLVSGTITDINALGDVITFDNVNGFSADPDWIDPATWSAKTTSGRGLILVADTSDPGSTFEVLSATDTTVTINGTLTAGIGNSFGLLYGQMVKTSVADTPVQMFDSKGGFVDTENVTPEGICQVCHTQTNYWLSDGTGTDHHPPATSLKNCYECHSHDQGFAHGGGNCADCHGLGDNTKHSVHLTMTSDCDTCHDVNNFPYFKSGTDANGDGKYTIEETDVCNTCHKDGAGGDPSATDYQTSANWDDTAYEVGCDGCHGFPPIYPNGDPKINSHAKHNEYNYNCSECHYDTTNDGTIISSPTLHINNVKDVTFADSLMSYNAAGNTCSNTYCHSNGITVEDRTDDSNSLSPDINLPRFIMDNTSAAWGGGSLSCDSCHSSPNDPITDGPDYPDASPDYQYKSNGHQDHGFLTCNYCHYGTSSDGITVTNKATHVNGTYDLEGDPAHVSQMNYFYDAGGGTCLIECHTPSWTAHHSPTAEYYWGFNTLRVRSAPYNDGCYTVRIEPDAYSTWGDGISGPFTYYIEYYDSAAQTDDWDQPHLLLGTYEGAGPLYFTYPGPPAPGTYGYPVKIWARDANNHRTADYHIQWAHPVSAPNQDPIPGWEVQVVGQTVTLIDKSIDPDYNTCGHEANGFEGTIRIDWRDYTPEQTLSTVELTDQPSNVPISHTYSKSGNLRLLYYVQDNDGSWWVDAEVFVTVPQ